MKTPRSILLSLLAMAAVPGQGAAQSPARSVGGDEVAPPWLVSALESPAALPAPTPGEDLVYFVPTDNDATATVLYLTNTDAVDHNVVIRGFSHNGALAYSLNVSVPATSFRRIASDSIAASPPPSWTTPAPIIANFTDFTYFASLSLPRGVKAEGYTLFNPTTGVVDPRLDQGATPLVFQAAPLLAPGVPQSLSASVTGGVVTVNWAAPSSGGLADSYILEVGSGPGLANLVTLPVASTSFSTSGVPSGTFYLRVRGVNALGTGPASTEVQLVVP